MTDRLGAYDINGLYSQQNDRALLGGTASCTSSADENAEPHWLGWGLGLLDFGWLVV
jgi:hypothetical protein